MALKKPIKIRPLTPDEYDEFMIASYDIGNDPDFQGRSGRIGNAIGKWIFSHIYTDVDITKITPATMAAVVNKTLDATNTVEEGDIKNCELSGSGELKEEQNSVKLADKQQKSEEQN